MRWRGDADAGRANTEEDQRVLWQKTGRGAETGAETEPERNVSSPGPPDAQCGQRRFAQLGKMRLRTPKLKALDRSRRREGQPV